MMVGEGPPLAITRDNFCLIGSESLHHENVLKTLTYTVSAASFVHPFVVDTHTGIFMSIESMIDGLCPPEKTTRKTI